MNLAMTLTKNFTLSELTISQEAAREGLPNTPTADHIANLRALCENILQPLRDRVRKPVIVSSGFRSVTINRRIGGSKSSQHCKGQAADFTIPGMTVAEVFTLIRKSGLPFDQVIDEFSNHPSGGWVHVSYGPRHRRQVWTARLEGGKTVYRPLF